MSKYIDELTELICDTVRTVFPNASLDDGYDVADDVIAKLPTIEVSEDCISRAEGVWINKHEWENGFFERECSVCGAMKPILMHTAKINYCPNCGAKMKGEEE